MWRFNIANAARYRELSSTIFKLRHFVDKGEMEPWMAINTSQETYVTFQ